MHQTKKYCVYKIYDFYHFQYLHPYNSIANCYKHFQKYKHCHYPLTNGLGVAITKVFTKYVAHFMETVVHIYYAGVSISHHLVTIPSANLLQWLRRRKSQKSFLVGKFTCKIKNGISVKDIDTSAYIVV